MKKSPAMITEEQAARLFDALASDKSDAALIANLTMSNVAEDYNSSDLIERYKRLAPQHIDDLDAAKARFPQMQNKSK